MRRRAETGFRPQQAPPYGQMAVQWLTWESVRTERSIRHQVNGREKRIGKLPVDGWCAKTHTAYQFHGCYFHGCPKCHDENEMNSVNGKTMAEFWQTRTPIRPTFDALSTLSKCGNVSGNGNGSNRMQPIFKDTTVTRNDIGPFMQDYAEDHDIMSAPRRMLVGSYRGDKILLSTPLLQWYLMHGLIVDHVYQVVEYEPKPCFRHFGESVSTARRAGDTDTDKAIIADTMKLLGNSGYGKTVTNIDPHRDVKYCTEVGTSALINNKRFRQLDVVTDDAYEIELNKQVMKYTLPLHIGFFVYQYAKLRMLQFYYDLVDRYVERPLFQYCEMDTDSAYIALAGETIDDLITSEHREHYFRHRSEWLPAECCDEREDEYAQARQRAARQAGRAWTATESCCFARKAFDKRTLGLFKVE